MDYKAKALYVIRFGKETATRIVTATGKYPTDAVARVKLTWKCAREAKRAYGSKNIVQEKGVKFYAGDGVLMEEIR